MSIYYDEYRKYKQRYIDIKQNQINDQLGGNKTNKTNKTKYICDQTMQYKDICYEDKNGIYTTKHDCIKICEGKYIGYNLSQAKLGHETHLYYSFVKELLKKGYEVYAVGGCVIPLKLLQMIYTKYPEKDFEKHLYKLVDLDLIKDWDFTCYTYKPLNDELKSEIDKLAKTHKLSSYTKSFILYHAKYHPIKIGDDDLFELAVYDDIQYNSLEIPLTRMRVKINTKTLMYIFMFSKSFYSYKKDKVPIDIDIVKKMIKHLDISAESEYENGLFKADSKLFNTGNLSNDMLKITQQFSKYGNNVPQLLMIHIMDPIRMYFRLIQKNMAKTNKINKFILSNRLSKNIPDWLISDIPKIEQIVTEFLTDVGNKLAEIYTKSKSIELAEEFMSGTQLGSSKISTKYPLMDADSKNLVKLVFGKIYSSINKSENATQNTTQNKSKLLETLKFLEKKGLFE